MKNKLHKCCSHCKDNAHAPHTEIDCHNKQGEGWEDKIYDLPIDSASLKDYEVFKAFFRSLLQAQKEDFKKKIKELRIPTDEMKHDGNCRCDFVKNEILEDILNLLDK